MRTVKVQLYSFFNLCARWGVGGHHQAPEALRREIHPLHIAQEPGWDPGTVWNSEENLVPTGIRPTARPSRSTPLYRLSYAGLQFKIN
jgi:hypothetical protein